MEDIRIDETVAGCIKIDFSHKYLQQKGISIQLLITDMDVAHTLIGEILLEVGFTEEEIEDSSFVIEAKFHTLGIHFVVYTPHTLTFHPYIMEGVEYDLPSEPVGYVVLHDEFLGGLCECAGCKHVRKFYNTMGFTVESSNVPRDGSGEFGFHGVDTTDLEDEEEDDEDYYEESVSPIEYFEDVQQTPKPSAMRPASSIDSAERNADFTIHDELIQSQQVPHALPATQTYKPSHVIFTFYDIEHVINVSRALAEVLDDETSLYSLNNRYFLVYDIENFGDRAYRNDIIKDLSAINVEYGGKRSKTTKYYLAEYGKEIISTNALSTLMYHFG